MSIHVRRICLLGGAVAVAGLVWYAHHRWETRYSVPVDVPTVLNRHDDEVPVVTTLHEYLDSGSSDETTGQSVSFSFPRSHYTFASNAYGGPQRRIGISVDRTTLHRINAKEEIEKLQNPYIGVSNAQVLARLGERNLDITVHSNKSRGLRGDYRRIQKAVDERGIKPIAAFCEMNWFLKSDVDGWTSTPSQTIFSTTPGRSFGYGADLEGYLAAAEIRPEHTATFCNAELSYCMIFVPFENWAMSFRIPRANLCNWPSELARVRTYLAEHVTERTERRDLGSD